MPAAMIVLALILSACSPACLACRGEVRKRARRNGQETAWFYRHRTGPDECPRRYRPVAQG